MTPRVTHPVLLSSFVPPVVTKKCSVPDCACRGTKDASETHDTGFRLGPPGLSIPIFVSTSIPDPPGWLMVSGDWKP